MHALIWGGLQPPLRQPFDDDEPNVLSSAFVKTGTPGKGVRLMFRDEAALTVCVFLSALVLVGCGSDGEANSTGAELGKPPAAMVDTWQFQSATLNGAPSALATVLDWHAGVERAEFCVEADGTYVYQEVDQRGGRLWFESGFVFVEGNEIDINLQMDGDGPVNETLPFTFTLVGDVLTITETTPSNTTLLTLARAPNP